MFTFETKCFSKGITFLEILCAMLLLGFAAIPIVGILWSNAAEADLANSYIFAQNRARDILNMVLDSLPFHVLQVSASKIGDLDGTNQEDYVGRIVKTSEYDGTKFLALLGNLGIDTYTRGEVKDERGNVYKIKLYVYPVPIKDAVDLENEITFSYLPRPKFEDLLNPYGKPSWYTKDQFVSRDIPQLPYDMPVATITVNARGVGAVPRENETFSIIKKLLLRIRWRVQKGPERIIEIITAKADLGKIR